MNFSDRLAKAMADAGYTQGALAKAVGMAQSSVNKLLNGAHGSRNTVALARVLGVSPEWLADGQGVMKPLMAENKSAASCASDVYRVEVFDVRASAGSGVITRDEFVETIKSIEYSSEEARSLFGSRPAGHIKMIAVNGDSMSGTFEPRDQIFVDVSVDFFDGDGIYIFTLDNYLYIKRLQLQHKRLAVISDNKKYETWYITDIDESGLNIRAKVLVSQSRAYKFHG
ncbi:helix-turn-helix transcriptional regulator [Cronobacter dublinensis]|uniref:XRE family transcriptional regulator n=1 Tax=Cronobacter dublinensis TaxID=413497 RepID=UPI000CFBB981|nr:helix-turn-helix transcriptional regulator [Cronobacter dublinensis]MDK1192519.1 helix-turn-helix transcriptional regulator [Cronobacter dublinensis]MDK1200977.1 helix-turn-helix transcriptional regulator [Cronobacter dublinensis]